ncbi:MAG TPA: hypothetical protein VGO80_22930 [Solirubrobacteraceae bacterium]|jgi:hypothetical protein|nr:hypothetical protein [Solirubrobacteraceae bacterium]
MSTAEEIRALVGTLPAGTIPLVLLPVQIQTRYVSRDGAEQLLVRVYPDEVHLDGHEQALTADEMQWGRRYWELIWPAARDTAALTRAWDALVDRFEGRRAAWVARRTTPTNVDKRPGAPPTFADLGAPRSETTSPPLLARALPDRWVVMAYRGGERVLLQAGAPIPDTLAVGPGSDEPPGAPPQADELPLDARMRWMVDFAEAERIGMGIRITLTAGDPQLDTLLVFGVNTALTPDAAATRFEGMLEAHHYTRGLAFLAPGTPTNNTAEVSSAFSRRDRGDFALEVAPRGLGTGTDGAEVARLIGIKREPFAFVEGATRVEDLAARRLHAALWPVTGGYFLEQIVKGFAPRELDAARRFFIDFVRGQGPLPALRIGHQPYGLLPAMSLEVFAATPAGAGRFVQTLRALRDVWRSSLENVPRLLPHTQGEERLVEILRMQPLATGYRARLALDRETFALPPGALPSDAVLRQRMQPLIDRGFGGNERFHAIFPVGGSRLLAAPLAQRDGRPPSAYITFLRTATFDDVLAGRVDPAPGTLLYALLRHSVLLAQAGTAYRIRVRRGELPDVPYREPLLVNIAGGEIPEPTQTLANVLGPDLRASIHTTTAVQEPEAAVLDELRQGLAHLQTMSPDALERHLTGSLDLFGYRLDAWVTALATRRLNEIRRQSARGIALGGFGWIENLHREFRAPVPPPPGEGDAPLLAAAERGGAIHAPSMGQAAAAAVLRSGYLTDNGDDGARPFAVDLRSRRVRLAQHLLDGVRSGQPLAALLGYRFERGLHEQHPGLALDRYIPALRAVAPLDATAKDKQELSDAIARQESAQAALDVLQPQLPALRDASTSLRAQLTAAEAQRAAAQANEEALAAELERLREMLRELRKEPGNEGQIQQASRRAFELGGLRIQAGQAVAAVAASIVTLQSQLVAVDGQIASLQRAIGERQRAVETAIAAVGAARERLTRSVVDGLELQRRWGEGSADARWDRTTIPFGDAAAGVPALLTAEGRAIDTELRTLDEAVDAVGDALTAESVYQLVRGNAARASASVDAIAHGEIQPPDLEVVQTPRPGAAVTHRLMVLFSAPPAAAPTVGARGARAAAEPALELWLRQMLGDLRNVVYRAEFVDAAGKVLLRRDNQRLGTLVASPLDALYLSAAAQPGSPSELQRLLEYALWRGAPATISDDARLRLLTDRAVELPAVLLSLGELLELLRAFREAILPARAVDERDLAPADSEPAPAVDAAQLAARADAAVEALRRARAALAAPDDPRERLADFAFLGFADAVPLAPRGGDALVVQATATLAEADRRLALVDAPTFDRAAASPDDQVRFDQERLRTVFGRTFRALPLLRPANLPELRNSFARSDELQGGDPLQALSWLQATGRVRPGASRLGGALMYAAALERQSALELRVSQLPFVAGERWIALAPPPGRSLPPGKVSIVAHLPRPFRADAPLTGLMIDEWVEVVPAAEVTTGIAFNYDGPGARPPQSILLAVTPPGVARWDVETLEKTLLESLELARLRTIDPQALSDEVVLQRALPALYVSLNLSDEALSTDFTKLTTA